MVVKMAEKMVRCSVQTKAENSEFRRDLHWAQRKAHYLVLTTVVKMVVKMAEKMVRCSVQMKAENSEFRRDLHWAQMKAEMMVVCSAQKKALH
jgi:hypothetical protein